MKRKNGIVFAMAGLLALSMPIMGQAEENYNIWIDEAEVKNEGHDLTVEVKTDGKSTDGLLEIFYDAAMLKVEETDVVWSSDVEMSSINVVDDGVLKMAYLSEEAIESGVLATIKFTTNENDINKDSIVLEGDVHDGNGNTLRVGEKVSKPAEETSPLEETQKPLANEKDAVSTGDGNRPGLWVTLCTIALGIMTGIVVKKRKHRRG